LTEKHPNLNERISEISKTEKQHIISTNKLKIDRKIEKENQPAKFKNCHTRKQIEKQTSIENRKADMNELSDWDNHEESSNFAESEELWLSICFFPEILRF
jgi:hypothetical protein